MKPGRKILLVVGAMAVLGIGGRPLLRRAPFFQVRQVEVVGARFLDPVEVTARLRLPDGLSLFDDLGNLASRIDSLPGVAEARVRRRWPAGLRLELREQEPVALTADQGGLALVDAAGTVLPFDPTRTPADLPIARGGPPVARVLAQVRATDPVLFAAVTTARRVGHDVALEVDGTRYLLRQDAGDDAIRALAAVARDLARRGRRYAELDGRFSDRVFVRGRPL